jgi:Tfp pilus assembly protein PilO
VRARVEAFSPRVLTGIAIGVVLLFAAAAWFLVVSPKRADASAARDDLAAAQSRLADAELELLRARAGGAPVVDVFRLAKAMPPSADHTGLTLEVSTLAAASGVTLEGMTPQPPLAGVGGPTLIPLSVSVRGRFFEIVSFLKRARALVSVNGGEIRATGRLLSARSVTLTESDTGKFPELDATVGFDAYVYDGPMEAPELEQTDEESEEPGTTAAGSAP